MSLMSLMEFVGKQSNCKYCSLGFPLVYETQKGEEESGYGKEERREHTKGDDMSDLG